MKQVFFRIVAFFFVPMLFVAATLSLAGVRGPIQLDDTFMNFLRKAAFVANGWNIRIPNIPNIPLLPEYDNFWQVVLMFLIHVANAFFMVCNWAINFMNFILQVFTFIVALIRLLFDLKNFNYDTTGPIRWWSRLLSL